VNVIVAGGVDSSFEAALLEFRLYSVRIPWFDSKRDVIDPRAARHPAFSESSVVRIASTDDDVPDFTDHKLVLTSLIVRLFPSQQVGVERCAFLVVTTVKER